MNNNQEMTFFDSLDGLYTINKAAKKDLGEDSYFSDNSDSSAVVSVFDGCGGLGARKYESFKDHTGAYVASRTVSGVVRDWYNKGKEQSWESASELAKILEANINEGYRRFCIPYDNDRLKIMGSMVRKFPTTMAFAYAEKHAEGIIVHAIWAGDSRVYIIDEDGLAQVTKDDTEVDDAYDNLMNDGAMTNVLSSDGKFHLNYKSIYITRPTIVFAATDGCFGYVTSPMEFEYLILYDLVNHETPEEFRISLWKTLADYAGDDLAMGIMSFYCGSYSNMRQIFARRLEYIEETYIKPIREKNSPEFNEMLWKTSYKAGYERILNAKL